MASKTGALVGRGVNLKKNLWQITRIVYRHIVLGST